MIIWPSHVPGTSMLGVSTDASWKYGPNSAITGTLTPSGTFGRHTARLMTASSGAAPPSLIGREYSTKWWVEFHSFSVARIS